MKKNYTYLTLIVLFLLSFCFTSCSKDETPTVEENNEQSTSLEEEDEDTNEETTPEKIIVYTGEYNYSFNDLPYAMFAVDENGSALWSFKYISEAVAIENDIIYAGFEKIESDDKAGSFIAALNVYTGETIWEVELEQYFSFAGGVSIDANNIYIVNASSEIFAYDKSTGNLNWSYQTERGGSANSNPVIIDDVLYCNVRSRQVENTGFSDDKIIALNTSNGNLIWEYTDTTDTYLAPITVNDKNIFTFSDESLIALKLETGVEDWTKEMELDLLTTTFYNDKLYSQSETNLYCFDATDGDELWNITIKSNHKITPFVDNNIVYTADIFNVMALNADNGNSIWNTYNFLYYDAEASPIYYDGHVYIGSKGLRCLDGTNGDQVWTFKAHTSNTISNIQNLVRVDSPLVVYDTKNKKAIYPGESGMRQ